MLIFVYKQTVLRLLLQCIEYVITNLDLELWQFYHFILNFNEMFLRMKMKTLTEKTNKIMI